MNINTDINILSNLPDLNIIKYFLNERYSQHSGDKTHHGFPEIKSVKSLKRFDKAIRKSLLLYKNDRIEDLTNSIYLNESISNDFLLLLFWNLSYNNDLFSYLNQKVFFPALYSGRISINSTEVKACIRDLQIKQTEIQEWTASTIIEISSAYLRLLNKMNLMEGKLTKTFKTPYLSDKMFILFVYWITAVEQKSNLLDSPWLQYSLLERPIFIERVLQKKFVKFYNLSYTGDNLKIETSIAYKNIYDAIK